MAQDWKAKHRTVITSVETDIKKHRLMIAELRTLNPSAAVTCPNCHGLTSIVRSWNGGPDPCYGVIDYVTRQPDDVFAKPRHGQRFCAGTCTAAEAIQFHEYEIKIDELNVDEA
jgi:hypothetical protein